MNESFSLRENDVTMNLLMRKLSHHNNVSMLIMCHELYPKGRNSVLFCQQLAGVYLHSIANHQKAQKYVYSYLSNDKEKRQYNQLFNEHILRINDGFKGNRHGSIFIKFMPSPYHGSRVGRFLTCNDHNHSIVHGTPEK